MRRRSKIDIIEDILEFLQMNSEGVPANRLATASNLPYDRLARILKELEERELIATKKIDNKIIIKIDKKGSDLLREIKRFKKLLKDFGVSI